MSDASPLTPEERRAAKSLGRVLGERWTLERVIGVGGMAAVYAGRAPDGSLAAIKLLHPEMALNTEVRQRFLREGMAANLVEHPGAVRVVDHATADDEETTYLVMELLDGESLADRRARNPVTPDELLDVLDQTLDVLIAAHGRGLVHRDLKPDNLFLTREGRVKVLDFGLARFLESMPGDLKTRTGIAMGTLPYMAPEQALGKRDEIDGRTDLFALGAVAFRILSGRRVHEADSEARLLMAMATQPAPPISSLVPSVPESVAAIVDLALAFARDARYPDARTMQNDVRAVRGGAGPPYASRVASARAEATRADRPAPIAVAPIAPVASIALSSPAPSTPRPPTPPPGYAAPPGYAVPRGYAPAAGRIVPRRSPATPGTPKTNRAFLIAGAALALLILAAVVFGVGLAASRLLSTADSVDGGLTGSATDEPDGLPLVVPDDKSTNAGAKSDPEASKPAEKRREDKKRGKGK
jgi:eukaryotic-like serine/threonine-protein kinase